MQQLDIRLPMGLLFLILGIILVGYSFTSDPVIYAKHSLRKNISFIWDVVFVLFSLAMLLLVAKAKKGRSRGWEKARGKRKDAANGAGLAANDIDGHG